MRARAERIHSTDGLVPLHGSQLPQPIGDAVPTALFWSTKFFSSFRRLLEKLLSGRFRVTS